MVSIPDLASECGISLRLRLVATGSSGRGPEYHGPCPTCGGNDRFHVWPEQNAGEGSFWCRKCGTAGDAIEFLRKFAGLSFREACSRLGRDLSDNTRQLAPHRHSTPSWVKQSIKHSQMVPRDTPTPADCWQRQARKYVDECATDLQQDKVALSRLRRERGINPETASRFSLGLLRPRYDDQHPCRYSSRKLWGLPPKTKGKFPDNLWLPRGLVIPCIINGQITRLRIRRPATDCTNGGPRYYMVPGSGTASMLIHDGQPAIVVVESELDAILIAQEVGGLAGVMAIGNDSARPDADTHKVLHGARLLLLAQDNDDAGQKSVLRWRHWYPHAYPCPVPGKHKDPGDAWQAGENLRSWIVGHLPSVWTEPKPTAEPEKSPSRGGNQKVRKPFRAWEIRNRDGLTYYVVTRPTDKRRYAKKHKTVFTIDEIKKANQMPEAMRRTFLKFCCAFPGSQLIDFRQWETTTTNK